MDAGLQTPTYPRDPGPTHVDEVSCQGNERRLSDCLSSRIYECITSLDAGVRCQTCVPGSNKSAAMIGILSSIIVLLVLLLVFVGIGGLVYPRCIRSKIKDKKYFSR